MNTTRATRSYLTAGVAALGAGAMALSAVQPVPEQTALVPNRVVTDLGTALLASSFDPITPWVDTITNSIDNISGLIAFALDKPFPMLQTVVANLQTYLGELTSGNAGLIPGQIFGNIQKFFTAPWSPGETGSITVGTATPDPFEIQYLAGDNSHLSTTVLDASPDILNTSDINFIALQLIAGVASVPPCSDLGQCETQPPLPVIDIVPVAAALNAINSYATGVVLGLLGPVLAPVGALINSVTGIVDFLGQSDFIGALNELVNIPANLVNGFLNGATLNLTPIVNLFAPGVADFVGLNLGGLIAGPVPMNGSLVDPNDAPTEFSGGTLFTSLAATANVGITIATPGLPTGPIGSLIGMGQYLSDELLVTPPPAPAAESVPAAEATTAEVTTAEATTAEVTTTDATAEVDAVAATAAVEVDPAPTDPVAGYSTEAAVAEVAAPRSTTATADTADAEPEATADTADAEPEAAAGDGPAAQPASTSRAARHAGAAATADRSGETGATTERSRRGNR